MNTSQRRTELELKEIRNSLTEDNNIQPLPGSGFYHRKDCQPATPGQPIEVNRLIVASTQWLVLSKLDQIDLVSDKRVVDVRLVPEPSLENALVWERKPAREERAGVIQLTGLLPEVGDNFHVGKSITLDFLPGA